MNRDTDPRISATRGLALSTALDMLKKEGVLAITYVSLSKTTGISRSTLYRHWPTIEQLRNDTFKLAATPPEIAPRTNGPLRKDLLWLLGILMSALNNTSWSNVVPQIIASAATDKETKTVINTFMKERRSDVRNVFIAAEKRGELMPDAPIEDLVNMAIAVPYFRKYIAGLPLNPEWLESHVDTLCSMAIKPTTG